MGNYGEETENLTSSLKAITESIVPERNTSPLQNWK
jgi:hypothetical protein